MLGMKNHFDISGSIEIREVDIAGVACMSFQSKIWNIKNSQLAWWTTFVIVCKAVPLAFHLCCFYFNAILVVCVPFPFGVWGSVWNLIVLVPDHCLLIYTGCRILEAGFYLDSSKQKHMKFLNFHQNPHENEIILAKRGIQATPLNSLRICPWCGSTNFKKEKI